LPESGLLHLAAWGRDLTDVDFFVKSDRELALSANRSGQASQIIASQQTFWVI
jgi:hypothetical protein